MATSKQILADIGYIVNTTFGSTDNPSFGFVEKRYKRLPYQAVVKKLRLFLRVEENTDLNYDFCVSLILSSGDGKVFLQLSLIDRYAVLMRLNEEGNCMKVITQSTSEMTHSEKGILQTLLDENITILGKDVLEVPIHLILHYAEPDETYVYNALFSDIEMLPWKEIS